jgi:hypothetical protein
VEIAMQDTATSTPSSPVSPLQRLKKQLPKVVNHERAFQKKIYSAGDKLKNGR